MQITLRGLKKISLNKWYAGSHWSNRKKIKDQYKNSIATQFKDVLSDKVKYSARYTFYFEKNALDASNCVAMLKMIEDIIFRNDKFDIVCELTIRSRKDKDERVVIDIEEYTDNL